MAELEEHLFNTQQLLLSPETVQLYPAKMNKYIRIRLNPHRFNNFSDLHTYVCRQQLNCWSTQGLKHGREGWMLMGG